MRVPILVVLGLACLGPGCDSKASKTTPPPPWFRDASTTSGLTWMQVSGGAREFFLPEIMGAGCALLDVDGDGDLDVYVAGMPTHEGSPPRGRLFRQDPGLRFVDVTDASGIEGHGSGVAVGDYDADGRPDLYLTNHGQDRLYHNEGGGKFRDVTDEAGLGDRGWGTSAAWFDADADGDLDLYVARYVALDPKEVCRDAAGRQDYCGPTRFRPVPDLLYRNLGNGRFKEVGAELGLTTDPRRGLGVVAADLTGDGLLDVFVANDNDPNHLWIQTADHQLREEGVARGVAYNEAGKAEAGMGIVCADLDGDGDLDLLLSHLLGESNTLYEQVAPGRFRDRTAARGLSLLTFPSTGFGVGAADFDHDGTLDLLQVNGHVFRGPQEEPTELAPFWRRYAQPSLLLRGVSGHYEDAGQDSRVIREALVGRGLALGDLDGDGDVDAVVTSSPGPVRFLENTARKRGHWISVDARTSAGSQAPGARIELLVGARRLVGVVPSGASYLSAHASPVHFGLGDSATIDRLRVTWPDARTEVFPGSPTDRVIVVVKGQGKPP